ncbi:MAG: ATP-binding protein, partial [Saprospiraceae bacterium]
MSPNLTTSLTFLRALLRARLAAYLGQPSLAVPTVPLLQEDETPFTRFVQHKRLNGEEFVALLTALAPHVQPGLFDEVMQEYFPQGGDFPALGGAKGLNYRGFLPTGDTVLFLLNDNQDMQRRLEIQRVFGSQHFFGKERILYLEEMKPGEPATSGKLILDPEYVELFTLGYVTPPRMNSSFPATRLDSQLDWDDLILSAQTQKQLSEIEVWIAHNDTLLYDWQMERKIKPGFRALFYGPPGTG